MPSIVGQIDGPPLPKDVRFWCYVLSYVNIRITTGSAFKNVQLTIPIRMSLDLDHGASPSKQRPQCFRHLDHLSFEKEFHTFLLSGEIILGLLMHDCCYLLEDLQSEI